MWECFQARRASCIDNPVIAPELGLHPSAGLCKRCLARSVKDGSFIDFDYDSRAMRRVLLKTIAKGHAQRRRAGLSPGPL